MLGLLLPGQRAKGLIVDWYVDGVGHVAASAAVIPSIVQPKQEEDSTFVFPGSYQWFPQWVSLQLLFSVAEMADNGNTKITVGKQNVVSPVSLEVIRLWENRKQSSCLCDSSTGTNNTWKHGGVVCFHFNTLTQQNLISIWGKKRSFLLQDFSHFDISVTEGGTYLQAIHLLTMSTLSCILELICMA